MWLWNLGKVFSFCWTSGLWRTKPHMPDKSLGLNTTTQLHDNIWSQDYHSHSITEWQQEMSAFTLWRPPPSRLTTVTSNLVRKALWHWWCFIVNIVSFYQTASPWHHIYKYCNGCHCWQQKMTNWNPHILQFFCHLLRLLNSQACL